ncbi:MAG: Retron-type reverse transcriptase [Parcubacteria group bacterium GW2011_GWC1_41_7]|nr:MAG: Retron-type reverse transcriptase [Parcubacteria group bacterium GW2011_GWC1_41_7]
MKIIALENLFLAWQEFSKGKTKKQDVQQFAFSLEDHIFQLHRELKDKTYTHQPYYAFFVRDPKLRHIHKATVRDRVLHHALFRLLYPLWDRQFIFDSYSCCVGKGTHKGVLRLRNFIRKATKNHTQLTYALKCDIQKFFDSIGHDMLKALVARRVQNTNVLWLIDQILDSFHTQDKESPPSPRLRKGVGIPLGNVISQLFANIYLHELDHFVKHTVKAKYYLRYCDDFVIVHQDKKYLAELSGIIQEFLQHHLHLSLHPKKVTIRKTTQGVDFLGYVILPHYIVLRTKTKRRIYKKIQQKMKNLNEEFISAEQYHQSVQSYLGVLKHCKGYKIKQSIIEITKMKKL